jgi:hypothetical protein
LRKKKKCPRLKKQMERSQVVRRKVKTKTPSKMLQRLQDKKRMKK